MIDFRIGLALVYLSLSGGALATADGPDFYRLRDAVPESGRIMRTEPASEAAPVFFLPADAQCLRSLGCQGGLSQQEFTSLSETEKLQRMVQNPRWCKLSYQGQNGWVEGRFLAEGACSDAAEPDRRVEALNLSGETGRKLIKGKISGYHYVDYQLPGKAGQMLGVSLSGSNGQNYFNITPPASDVAMFVGSTSGNRFERLLPTDGVYTVRVYLMRAAARRHETSRYVLRFNVSGKPLVPRPAHLDALIPGTSFHASGTVACAYDAPALSQRCDVFVIRRGFDGGATLEVRWPAGALEPMRRILFVNGVPRASDSVDSLQYKRHSDMTTIRIGDRESVEVPDALINGG